MYTYKRELSPHYVFSYLSPNAKDHRILNGHLNIHDNCTSRCLFKHNNYIYGSRGNSPCSTIKNGLPERPIQIDAIDYLSLNNSLFRSQIQTNKISDNIQSSQIKQINLQSEQSEQNISRLEELKKYELLLNQILAKNDLNQQEIKVLQKCQETLIKIAQNGKNDKDIQKSAQRVSIPYLDDFFKDSINNFEKNMPKIEKVRFQI